MGQGKEEVALLHRVGTVAVEGSPVVEGSPAVEGNPAVEGGSAVEDSLHPLVGSH